MTEAQQMAATPVEIVLGGKTYRMAPITLADQADFEAWVQQRVCANARAGGLNVVELSDVAVRAAGISFYSVDATAASGTIAGRVQLLWLGIRRKHKDVKPADLMAAATAEELATAMRAFRELNYPPAKEAATDQKKPTAAENAATESPASTGS